MPCQATGLSCHFGDGERSVGVGWSRTKREELRHRRKERKECVALFAFGSLGWFEKRKKGFDFRWERKGADTNEVVGFYRVGAEVVEFGGAVVGRSGEDFPAGGADAAEDRAVVADAVVEDDGDLRQGFAAEGGREGAANPVRRRGDAGEIRKRRRKVDQTDLLRHNAPRC